MKKILQYVAVAFISLFALSSCEFNEAIVPSKTFIYEKTATRYPWEGTANSGYFRIPVPELTEYYLKQGIVNIGISFDNEGSYNSIPATINGVSYNYEYKPGSITIYGEDPIMDDQANIVLPNNLVIKVSLTDSDWVE